jgi:hypothetical protein
MGQELGSRRSELAAVAVVAPVGFAEEEEVVGALAQGTGPSGHGAHEGGSCAEGVVEEAVDGRRQDLDTACLGDPIWGLERQELGSV